MNRIENVRKAEKEYHDYCYDNYTLFEKGSWLYKPVKTVMDLLSNLESKKNINVLDLGSGVGRNSIPIAETIKGKQGKVVCVDLLDSALQNLRKYSKQFKVDNIISTVKSDIGKYDIEPDGYDFIVAVSSLEHVETEEVFNQVLEQMKVDTRINGMNCIIVNSEVKEINTETNEMLDAGMEVNIETEKMLNKLQHAYDGWEVLKQLIKPLEYAITRNEKPILLKTNAITYVVRKSMC